MKKYDIALLTKQLNEGLTEKECAGLFAMLKEKEALPLDICDGSSGEAALGFMTMGALKDLHWDTDELKNEISRILQNICKKGNQVNYQFEHLVVYLNHTART